MVSLPPPSVHRCRNPRRRHDTLARHSGGIMRSGFARATAAAVALLLAARPTLAAPPPTIPAPSQHVLVLSIDGLHDVDLTDPATAQYLPTITDLMSHGLHYANAHAVTPTDNFPNVLAQFTGAHPKTTGIYYDESYD